MPSSQYPEIDKISAVEALIHLKGIVATALDPRYNRATAEECEGLVESLGEAYSTDPADQINARLARVSPAMLLDAIHGENPTFSLNDPAREIVATVVSAIMSLRATAHELLNPPPR